MPSERDDQGANSGRHGHSDGRLIHEFRLDMGGRRGVVSLHAAGSPALDSSTAHGRPEEAVTPHVRPENLRTLGLGQRKVWRGHLVRDHGHELANPKTERSSPSSSKVGSIARRRGAMPYGVHSRTPPRRASWNLRGNVVGGLLGDPGAFGDALGSGTGNGGVALKRALRRRGGQGIRAIGDARKGVWTVTAAFAMPS
jgi:hypothetical protein